MSDLLVSPAKASRRLRHSRWPESAALAARLAVAVVLVLLAGPAVLAADTGGSSVQAQDPLAAARTQVAACRWAEAMTELKRVNATTSADWQNLMGYCLRNASPPGWRQCSCPVVLPHEGMLPVGWLSFRFF